MSPPIADLLEKTVIQDRRLRAMGSRSISGLATAARLS
jgi:hypothetical protein